MLASNNKIKATWGVVKNITDSKKRYTTDFNGLARYHGRSKIETSNDMN